MSVNKHFDCLKNTLPDNWTNSNATGYYNRAFWKRCKCEYGTMNPCKETADKWNPVANEHSKWTDGCSPCSDYYNAPPKYHYTYNPEDCGNCNCHNGSIPKHHCKPHHCDSKKDGKWSFFDKCDKWDKWDKCDKCHKWDKCDRCDHNKHDKCDKCHKWNKCDDRADNKHCDKDPLKSYVYNSRCSDCQDFAIVYRMINEEMDCDNIVELKIPVGGTKELYLAKHFPPEFVYANRFQCATVPVYNAFPNNLIDNMREEEFTISDQAALTKRGIKNALFAKQLIDEGKLIHEKHSFQIPMNVCGRTGYYYFGDCINSGSTATGLSNMDIHRGYFNNLG